jgi:hypothetical protein
MRTKLIASVVAISIALGIGWYVVAQEMFPFGPLPLFSPNTVLTANQLNEMVKRINTIIEFINNDRANVPQEIVVHCPTDSLTTAINKANNGDTIKISGTCTERVTIFKDGLTLDGQGSAILDGGGGFTPPPTLTGFSEGVITILGARGVVIKGLTVQHGPDGISGNQGASFTVQNVTAQHNADDGIQVSQNSTAQMIDCTAEDNGSDGFVAANASHAIFFGTIISTGNADDGIHIAATSSGTITAGAIVQAHTNGLSATFGSNTFDGGVTGDGIRVTSASQLFVSSNSHVEAIGNKDNGIAVTRTSTFSAFGAPEIGPVAVTSEGNGRDGVQVGDVAFFTVGGTQATLIVRNNAARGLNVFGGSRITCINTTVTKTPNGQADAISNGSCP